MLFEALKRKYRKFVTANSATRLKLLKRAVWYYSIKLFSTITLGICVVVFWFRLLWVYKDLRRSRKIVIQHEGGFGHTITGPEAARRLFKGKYPIYIILSERIYHNPLVSKLWPDIKVLFLRLVVRLRIFNRTVFIGGASLRTRELLAAVIIRIFSIFTGAEIISLRDLYDRLYAIYPTPEASHNNELDVSWFGGFFRLLETVQVPRPSLPDSIKRDIHNRIERFVGNNQSITNYCCLYLRAKGISSLDPSSVAKDGSPVEAYLPAITFLIEQGYIVLVTGDRDLEPSYARQFNGRLICARFLGADPWRFNLFAAMEASIWIGDSGGGPCIPLSMKIPYLSINLFPYGFCLPNAHMFYKTVRDEKGYLVHYRRLFAEHAYDHKMQGLTICNNTPEEIKAAVMSFLKELNKTSEDEYTRRVMQSLPDHVIAKYINGRLSPAWLHLFDPDVSV